MPPRRPPGRRPPIPGRLRASRTCSTSMRSGTCATSAPTLPIISPKPDSMANRSRGNQCVASLSVTTQPTAVAPPTIRRPTRGERVAARRAEEARADGRRDRARDQQPARAPGVDQDAGRDLHRDVRVEVHRGEVPELARADPEVAHQLRRHHGGRRAQVEGREIEGGRDATTRTTTAGMTEASWLMAGTWLDGRGVIHLCGRCR